MHSQLFVGLLLSSSLSFAAAPKCSDRVKSLKALGETYRAKAMSAEGPVQLSYPAEDSLVSRLETREGWKTRGVRPLSSGQSSEGNEAAMVNHLTALAKETKVELCSQLETPIEQKLSLDADAKVLAPMLKAAASVEGLDRATVIASELAGKGECKGVSKTVEAVGYAAPSDRLHILLTGTAESLEECKCPSADAERVYAALTLMADVWDAKTTCAPVTLGKPGAAKPVVMSGTLADFVAKLSAAGAAGVELKAK